MIIKNVINNDKRTEEREENLGTFGENAVRVSVFGRRKEGLSRPHRPPASVPVVEIVLLCVSMIRGLAYA